MRLPNLGATVALALAAMVSIASAADELVLTAFEDGVPASGLEAVLDGDITEFLDDRGSATFDLSAGPHTIELLLAGIEVHKFSFNIAAGQLADVTINLETGEDPKHFVESYFPTETARDRAAAPKGNISGVVRNNGVVLSGASIAVSKLGTTITTGEDGRFAAELPRGVYTLTITHPELDAAQTEEVRVVSGLSKGLRLAYGGLGDAAGDVEEVVVTGTFDPTAFGESEQFSVNIIDTLGIEELARFGDSDVAASVIRVPSVTVQSGRFVFIRGLGGRYITTTLNGATLPSTDPTKREVPLDLFPSNIVKQLDIKKSFLASMPGESTGGNLVINTRTFPEEAAGKLSFSLGYTSGLTGEEVAADPSNGSYDFFGFDDGTRDVPAGVSAISSLLACQECEFSITPGQRQALSQIAAFQLSDNLDLDSTTAIPNLSLGVNYGDVFDLGGNELGFFVAGNFKNGWSQKTSGVSRTLSATRFVLDDFTFEEASNTVDASGLVSVGLNVGNSSYQANTLVSRATESKVRVSQGIGGDSGAESIRYSIEWEERQFLSQQFAGEHLIGADGNLIANWQATASQARRYAPDRRDVRFDLEGEDGVFDLLISNLARRYEDLSDDSIDISGDLDYLTDNLFGEATAEFGAQTIRRERDSDTEIYGFAGNRDAYDSNAPNLRVDDVIRPENITGDGNTGLTFTSLGSPSDNYTAELELDALYASITQRFADVYQVILGLRYEDYRQQTDTFSVFGAGGPVQSLIEDDVFLPSLSVNWEISGSQQLRFAASRTVSRPDFKETAFSTFTDDQFDFRVRGNPFLTTSDITNLDLRWEMYWSDTESVSVALFQKVIEDAIERTVVPASGTASNTRSFQNASDDADIMGIEFDGRRDFDLNDAGSRTLFVTVNASLIDSEIQVDDGGGVRQLQGQPDYTFNLALGYDDFAGGIRQEVTALFNQAGETTIDVGLGGLPDVIEQSRFDVDLNYKAYLTDSLVFKAKVGNLLDEKVEFTQGGQTIQEFEQGVTFEAGIDWNF